MEQQISLVYSGYLTLDPSTLSGVHYSFNGHCYCNFAYYWLRFLGNIFLLAGATITILVITITTTVIVDVINVGN
jgi:hypothetical protein